MNADLDALATALYATIDDTLKTNPILLHSGLRLESLLAFPTPKC